MNQKEGMKASDVINDYPEEKLAGLFWLYGELQNGRQVPKSFIAYRILLCTGFNPSLTSGSARPTMTDIE